MLSVFHVCLYYFKVSDFILDVKQHFFELFIFIYLLAFFEVG